MVMILTTGDLHPTSPLTRIKTSHAALLPSSSIPRTMIRIVAAHLPTRITINRRPSIVRHGKRHRSSEAHPLVITSPDPEALPKARRKDTTIKTRTGISTSSQITTTISSSLPMTNMDQVRNIISNMRTLVL